MLTDWIYEIKEKEIWVYVPHSGYLFGISKPKKEGGDAKDIPKSCTALI
jgi:hypothetical protein